MEDSVEIDEYTFKMLLDCKLSDHEELVAF